MVQLTTWIILYGLKLYGQQFDTTEIIPLIRYRPTFVLSL